MIAHLLAAGVLAVTPPAFSTPASRTLAITGANLVAAEVLDPWDRLDFVFDLSQLLEQGEAFASIDFDISPETVPLGFEIMTEAPYAPVVVSNTKVRLWLTVEATKRAARSWSGQGTICNIEFRAISDSVPPRHKERTVGFRIRQR